MVCLENSPPFRKKKCEKGGPPPAFISDVACVRCSHPVKFTCGSPRSRLRLYTLPLRQNRGMPTPVAGMRANGITLILSKKLSGQQTLSGGGAALPAIRRLGNARRFYP